MVPQLSNHLFCACVRGHSCCACLCLPNLAPRVSLPSTPRSERERGGGIKRDPVNEVGAFWSQVRNQPTRSRVKLYRYPAISIDWIIKLMLCSTWNYCMNLLCVITVLLYEGRFSAKCSCSYCKKKWDVSGRTPSSVANDAVQLTDLIWLLRQDHFNSSKSDFSLSQLKDISQIQ